MEPVTFIFAGNLEAYDVSVSESDQQRMKKGFGKAVILSLTCYTVGCSSPQLHLLNSGTLVLSKKTESVEIRGDRPLSMTWGEAGHADSTRAVLDGVSRRVQVQIVEANEMWVRVKSDHWTSQQDLPLGYVTSTNLRSAMRSGGYDKPVVSIPFKQIREIILYEKIKSKEPANLAGIGKDVRVGAIGGAVLGFSWGCEAMIEAAYLGKSEQEDAKREAMEALIFLPVLGGAVGSVAYPAYRLFSRPYYEDPRVYDVTESGDYSISISK